jgi:hypothetical protein
MSSFRASVALAACALVLGACAEHTVTEPTLAPSTVSADALSAMLTAAPVGYGDLSTSYVGSTAAGFSPATFFLGGGMAAKFDQTAMMGGGLASEFMGSVSLGPLFPRFGPQDGGLLCPGTYNASSGRVECATQVINGFTIARSAAYKTAAGATQQAFDTVTTNSVNLLTRVSGTVVYDTLSNKRGPNSQHGWGMDRGPLGQLLGDTTTILSATTAISSTSDRTTSGLAKGSSLRSVNSSSSGSEATTGRSSRGAFTSSRVVGDTVKGLVTPIGATFAVNYPMAGTVVRSMKATIAYAGQAPASTSRREVVTYTGSATVTVVITENGVTKTCARTLPFGRLVCP